MKILLAMLTLLIIPQAFSAPLPSFRERYNLASIDMVPEMQISACQTKPGGPDKSKGIIECTLKLPDSLLTLDTKNGKLSGIWLMYDASRLDNPAENLRVSGMLLRALRGVSQAGDHLAVASELFNRASKNDWKETCMIDTESKSNYCVSSTNRQIFNLILVPSINSKYK